jgi:hypothetical protein
MNKIKKHILWIGLGLGGLLMISSGEINHLKCTRSDRVDCKIDRQQYFPGYADLVSIKGVERAELEVKDFDEFAGGRIIIISHTGAVPLTKDFVSADEGRRKIVENINRFLKSTDRDFELTDLPWWTYLFGLGFISASLLCWWLIPVSKFDKF